MVGEVEVAGLVGALVQGAQPQHLVEDSRNRAGEQQGRDPSREPAREGLAAPVKDEQPEGCEPERRRHRQLRQQPDAPDDPEHERRIQPRLPDESKLEHECDAEARGHDRVREADDAVDEAEGQHDPDEEGRRGSGCAAQLASEAPHDREQHEPRKQREHPE